MKLAPVSDPCPVLWHKLGAAAVELYSLCLQAASSEARTRENWCAKLQEHMKIMETYATLLKLSPILGGHDNTMNSSTTATAGIHTTPRSASSGHLSSLPPSPQLGMAVRYSDVASPPWSPSPSSPQLADSRQRPPPYSPASSPTSTSSSRFLSSISCSSSSSATTSSSTPQQYQQSSPQHQHISGYLDPTSRTPPVPAELAPHGKPFKRKRRVHEDRTCSECGRTHTSQWRSGPGGLVLCNACGMRYFRKQRRMEREECGGYLSPLEMAGSDVMSSPLRLSHPPFEPTQHKPQRRHAPLAPAPLAPQLDFSHDLHNKRSSIYGLLN